MTYLDIDGVTFTYESEDDPALEDVTCAIERGTFLGITGPTDAGKSTFCRLLPGFLPNFFDGNFEGTVRVAGIDPTTADIATLGDTIGIVFENPFDQLTGAATTVLEEVAFGLEQRGVPADEIQSRARHALERVGIPDIENRDPNTLSGGQLQRVAIASVLALNPEVLVFDEPTTQLDPEGTAAVFDIAARAHREGYTVVFVSQALQRLAPRTDRLLVFEQGQLIRDGSPRTLLAESALDEIVRVPPTIRFGRGLREAGDVSRDRPLPLTVPEAVEEAEQFTDGAAARRDGGGGPQTEGKRETPRIQLEEVRHIYDSEIEALADISLALDKGCIAVLGPNGAGKTTLAKHLNGLLKPTDGRMVVRGADTQDQRVAELAADVGLVFQNPDAQLFRSTVADEIRFGPENLGRSDIESHIDDAIDRLALEAVRDANTYELGRPVRKRVALASVLAMDTPVVVLDEPTGGQDAMGVDVISEVIEELVAEGQLVVCITHDVEFARDHADRVVVLGDGSVIADGSPNEVFTDEGVLDETSLRPPVAVEIANALGLSDCLSIDDVLARLV